MNKSNFTHFVWAIGAILLICCSQLYIVQAQQRRGGGDMRGGMGGPQRGGERGIGGGGEGGRIPSTLPSRPDDGNRPGRGGDAQPTNVTINHNHIYGGDSRATAVAPSDAGYAAGYAGAPAGYAGYTGGGTYNYYGPGTGAINRAQAENQSIQNHNYSVQSYYANKDVHDQYVAAHREPRLTAQQQAQIAQVQSPGRLSPAQFDRTTNIINWPQMLRGSEFTEERTKIDHLFDERTPSDSGVTSQNYVDIKTACDNMKQTLVKKLRDDPDLPAVSFCAIDHFIRSVAYEASFTVHASS